MAARASLDLVFGDLISKPFCSQSLQMTKPKKSRRPSLEYTYLLCNRFAVHIFFFDKVETCLDMSELIG